MKVKKIGKDPEIGEIYLAEDFDYSQIRVVIIQGEKITFEKHPQSVVKSLEVNIYSTESQDMAILHKLHTNTRSV